MSRFRDRRAERTGNGGNSTPWWRWMVTIILGFGVVLATVYYFKSTDTGSAARMVAPTETITLEKSPSKRDDNQVIALSAVDERLNDTQREVVNKLARRHVGSPIRGGDLDDLRIIQRLLDLQIFDGSDSYELQSMGVVLGDVFARQLNLRWVIVNDEYGRSRALQISGSEDMVYPITMISKRVEVGIDVDVMELYADIEEALSNL